MLRAYFVRGLLVCALLCPCYAQVALSGSETARRPAAANSESSETPPKELSAPPAVQKRAVISPVKNITREQKKSLSPDDTDLKRYDVFLSQPNTGLIRLFPDLGCETAMVVRADENCRNAIPMSGFYSFREKKYTRDFLSDIRLKDGVLMNDGLLVQGFMVVLGDVALDDITLSSDGMKFLNDFVPDEHGAEALKQTGELLKGVKSGVYLYRKAMPVIENVTYILRSIAYRGSYVQKVDGKPFDLLAGDERLDLTVAFRVLKKNDAGSIILLWKELARKSAPVIIFPKRN